MMKSLLQFTALLTLMLPVISAAAVSGFASDPKPPPLKFLYEMFAEVETGFVIPNTPQGDRGIYPIVGGVFSGPKISGKVLNLGADWGLAYRSGAFYPDTRYNLVTDDGHNVYIRTNGAYQPDTSGHLEARFESSLDGPYAWLNDVVGYGLIEAVTRPILNTTLATPKLNEKNLILRIRLWHFEQGVLSVPSP